MEEAVSKIQEKLNNNLEKGLSKDFVKELECFILHSEDLILTINENEIILDFYLNLTPSFVAELTLIINKIIMEEPNFNLEIGNVFNFDNEGKIEFDNEAEEIENKYMNEYVKSSINKAIFLDRLIYSEHGYEC